MRLPPRLVPPQRVNQPLQASPIEQDRSPPGGRQLALPLTGGHLNCGRGASNARLVTSLNVERESSRQLDQKQWTTALDGFYAAAA